MKLKKGSKAAKKYMASIRKMKKTSAKKVGAIKIVEKGESKNAKPSAVYQYNRTKKGTFKGLKKIGATSSHTDTKSHNINIKMGTISFGVESGIKSSKKSLSTLKSAAEKYAKYQKKYFDAYTLTNGTGYVVITTSDNNKSMWVLSFVGVDIKGKTSYSKPNFVLFTSSKNVNNIELKKNDTYKKTEKFNK